jgi:uncharacterized protein (UPF0332 family)
MVDAGLNEDAARTAYMACFHVAQADIFEREHRALKSHHGVQTEFYRLARSAPDVDPELRAFLSRSFAYKATADYATGPDAVTTPDEAREALQIATRFVDTFARIIVGWANPDGADLPTP